MIDKAAFLRSFEVTPNKSYGIFLGAGASSSAGIPTSSDLIWEFKRKLYCDHFHIKEEKFKDLGSAQNRNILQEFFDKQKDYPKLDDRNEYSFYFEKCYPNETHRRYFIQQKVNKIDPSLGFRCLAELMKTGKIDHIWTTNFDEMVERGLILQKVGSHKLISPDNAHQVDDFGSSFPKVIKLHGDYRYDHLKNLQSETIALDEKVRQYLVKMSLEQGLIVIGYSGFDKSIIDAINEALDKKESLPNGLIWAIRTDSKPHPDLINLMEKATKLNDLSGFICIDSFDEFLYELYSRTKINDSEIEHLADNLFEKSKKFLLPQATPETDLIKLNGILVKIFPRTIYRFTTNLKTWKELREICQDTNIIATFHGAYTYAFGSVDDIKNIFSQKLSSSIDLVDVENKWLTFEDGFFLGLIYDLISHSLIKDYHLRQSHSGKIVRRFYNPKFEVTNFYSNGSKRNISTHFKCYEAFEIQLQYINKSLYCLILPTVEVVDTRISERDLPSKELVSEKQELINSIISNRYNKSFGEKIIIWLSYLKSIKNTIDFSIDDFKIEVANTYSYGGYKSKSSLDFFQNLSLFKEPKLIFSSVDSSYKGTHPLKGLKKFGPYDTSFSGDKNTHVIRLGIIAPSRNFKKILDHLDGLSKSTIPASEKEYLIDYPGFNILYKAILEFPRNTTDKHCVTIDETEVNGISLIQFYELMKRKLDYFDTIRGEFDILLIYFPYYWEKYREDKTEYSYFDLHDSLKIYAAKKNIKIQFVEDKSIQYFDKNRINWWLSLALYVKANGIPWKNEPLTEDTAYIGIGHAIKKSPEKNEIVIGCSQLFDSSGQGLRFLLYPLENPVFFGKNPYMSKEDARRFILKLKDTYYKVDPNSKLRKLVIHKTTRFTKDEIEGIALGAEGIPSLELLQIQQFSYWRAVRSNNKNGIIEPHMFPIQRGTVLQLDNLSFLLWTHGSVTDKDIMPSGMNYYQGKRGIPSPLLIRRFRGQDDIETIANSILNLTKMNWNGGQLYKTLPVTLDFSKKLSGVAKQSETLQNMPYDFRYFM